MPTFNINEPVLGGGEFFDVEIKNSLGVTVFSSSVITNAPFDPSITTAGEYILYVSYAGGEPVGFCFSITECVCNIPTVEIVQEGSLRYAVFEFDLSGGFCPFGMDISYGGGSSSAVYPVYFYDLSSFTSNVGFTYTKKILLYPDSTFITYTTYKELERINACIEETTVTIDCVSPTIESVELVFEGGDYKFRITYSDCGSDCNEVSWGFSQVGGGTGGVFGDIVACSPFIGVYDHDVIPVISGGVIAFNLSATNCCGFTQYFEVEIDAPCDAPEIDSVVLIDDGGANATLRMTFNDCGDTCHNFIFSGGQNWLSGENPGTGGISFTLTIAIPCGGSFPYVVDYPISFGGTLGSVYRLTLALVDCCGFPNIYSLTKPV